MERERQEQERLEREKAERERLEQMNREHEAFAMQNHASTEGLPSMMLMFLIFLRNCMTMKSGTRRNPINPLMLI